MDRGIDELVFEVSEPSDNAQVVFGATQMLARMGFERTKQVLIASAVSELATNIIRYAKKGSIILQDIQDGEKRIFVVTARDNGPGIMDMDKAMEEQYSTGKGLGLGLPAVRRIMDEFEIRSGPGQGTCITAKKWINHAEHRFSL